jgi:hypothetical protein
MDLAYFAGYRDGEGCFEISNKSSPRISVSNTYLPMLENFKQLFGGSVREKADGHRTRETYEFYVCGAKALAALRLVRPYLREKGEQADILLSFANYLPRIAAREKLCAKLKSLKRIRYYFTEVS